MVTWHLPSHNRLDLEHIGHGTRLCVLLSRLRGENYVVSWFKGSLHDGSQFCKRKKKLLDRLSLLTMDNVFEKL